MAEAFTLDKTKISGKIGEFVTGLVESVLLLFTGPLKLLEDWGIGGEWIKSARESADSISDSISHGFGLLIGQFVEWISSLFSGPSTPAPEASAATAGANPKATPKEESTEPSPGSIPEKPASKEPAKGASR